MNKIANVFESKLMSRRNFIKNIGLTALGMTAGSSLLHAYAQTSQVEGTLIDVNGTSLFHDVTGVGTPMLMMHGGLGLDHAYFRPTLDDWGEFAELHFYDHRGNGRSAAPSNWDDVTLDTYVEDAEALRQALGLDTFILYGHSYGGFIAQEYALRYQDHLAGLILASTSPNVGYAPNFPAWAPETGLDAINRIFSGPMESDEEWAETWAAALPVYWKNLDPSLAADIHSRTNYKAAAWNRAAMLLADYNTSGRLEQVNVPTLLLSGREDFVTGPTAHMDMHAELPNSSLVFFEDSGHFPFITEKDYYKTVVEDWVGNL
ncbi:MAG: alpha/beta fold hydrolase [Deinococcota bacterium]